MTDYNGDTRTWCISLLSNWLNLTDQNLKKSCLKDIMHHITNAALPCLQDSKVHVYSLENGTLKAVRELSHTGAITCLEFSPDGAYLAVGDSNRKVCLYQCPDYEVWILVT